MNTIRHQYLYNHEQSLYWSHFVKNKITPYQSERFYRHTVILNMMVRFIDANIIEVIHKMIEEEDHIVKVRQSSSDLFKFDFWFNSLSFSIYKVGEFCELVYYPRPSRDSNLLMKPFHSADPPSEIRFESLDFIFEEEQAAFHELFYIVSQKVAK